MDSPSELMKLVIASLFVIPVFADTPYVPCISPLPGAAPAASAQTQPRRPVPPRTAAQQSAADIAEIASLSDLPAWGQNLANDD